MADWEGTPDHALSKIVHRHNLLTALHLLDSMKSLLYYSFCCCLCVGGGSAKNSQLSVRENYMKRFTKWMNIVSDTPIDMEPLIWSH